MFIKYGELCGKTRHTFFGSARLVSGPYSVCMADSTALSSSHGSTLHFGADDPSANAERDSAGHLLRE